LVQLHRRYYIHIDINFFFLLLFKNFIQIECLVFFDVIKYQTSARVCVGCFLELPFGCIVHESDENDAEEVGSEEDIKNSSL
jgi:hypothetical protein